MASPIALKNIVLHGLAEKKMWPSRLWKKCARNSIPVVFLFLCRCTAEYTGSLIVSLARNGLWGEMTTDRCRQFSSAANPHWYPKLTPGAEWDARNRGVVPCFSAQTGLAIGFLFKQKKIKISPTKKNARVEKTSVTKSILNSSFQKETEKRRLPNQIQFI